MHPNERVLRAALDAIIGGLGEDRLAEVIADDVVVHFPGGSRLAGDHLGRGAIGVRVRELSGAPLRIEVHDVLASDDHAVGIYRMSVEHEGRRLEWRHVNVYHFRDGKIAEVWHHPFEHQAVDAFFATNRSCDDGFDEDVTHDGGVGDPHPPG